MCIPFCVTAGYFIRADDDSAGPRRVFHRVKCKNTPFFSLLCTFLPALTSTTLPFPPSQQERPAIPQHGVIVYLSAEETRVDLIQPHWAEMCALVASRNKLATFIRDSSSSASGAGLSGGKYLLCFFHVDFLVAPSSFGCTSIKIALFTVKLAYSHSSILLFPLCF